MISGTLDKNEKLKIVCKLKKMALELLVLRFAPEILWVNGQSQSSFLEVAQKAQRLSEMACLQVFAENDQAFFWACDPKSR